MLDLHVHVLPGIDDGPRTLDDALALARALSADGIEHVVATPHIYPGVFDNTPQRIAEAFDRLQAAVADDGLPLTMSWAAEVRICPEIIDWVEQRRLPLLDGSLVGPSTALIELPDGQIPVGTDKLAGLLLDRGITPLIAHPERNKAVMEMHTRLEPLRRMGCLFQLTAASVLGEFGSRAQASARQLLDAGWVDVLATDAHNLSGRRPRMRAAREWLEQNYDAALAERLTVTTPQRIAGVSSFSMETAGQKLVFRDLPQHAQAEDDSAWRSGLGDLTDLPAFEPARSPDALFGRNPEPQSRQDAEESPHGRWTLTDFRIDAVVEDLNQASLQAGAPGPSDTRAPAAETLGDVMPPAAPPASDEDWLLPDFGAAAARPPAEPEVAPVVPAPQPAHEPLRDELLFRPEPVRPPPAAPTPTPAAPARPRSAPVAETRQTAAAIAESAPVQTQADEQAHEQTHEQADAARPAKLFAGPLKRLRQMLEPSEAAPVTAPAAPPAAEERPPLQAQPPVELPESTTPAMPSPVAAPAPALARETAAPEPRPMPEPVALASEPVALAPPETSVRGMRLSDLTALSPVLGTPAGGARMAAAATAAAPLRGATMPESAAQPRQGAPFRAAPMTSAAPAAMPPVTEPPVGEPRGFRLRDLPFLKPRNKS